MAALDNPQNPLRIERLPQVKHRTGYSRSSLYAMILAGKFPAPIHLGGRAVGWLTSEIDEWINSRVFASRGGAR
jgi:prophage regulatory protein